MKIIQVKLFNSKEILACGFCFHEVTSAFLYCPLCGNPVDCSEVNVANSSKEYIGKKTIEEV